MRIFSILFADLPMSLWALSFPVDFSTIAGLVLLFVLLLCSALISGVEVAVFSLNKTQVEEGLDKHPKAMQIIARLLDQPKKTLATILVANNFINIGIVILFAYLNGIFFNSVNTLVDLYFFKLDALFLIDVVIATSLILFFGEIIPKVYASRNNVKFSIFMARPLQVLDFIISPFSTPMQKFTLWVQKKLGKTSPNIDVDRLSQALELTDEEETTHQEQKILQGIVSFGNIDTKQVMQPRIDLFALEKSQKYDEILPEIVEKGYSRIPVYEDNIDHILGILYAKDLLPHLEKKQFDWVSLLRKPLFVPENKKLDDLMLEFKEKKVHIAIVVDEYGGTSGIISLEDIIEEIVGDISDEFDDDDIMYSKIDDKTFVFEGKTSLKDFYRIVKLEDNASFEEHKGEAESIAGFVLEISGNFPKNKSKVHFNGYTFTVDSVNKKRIERLNVTLP